MKAAAHPELLVSLPPAMSSCFAEVFPERAGNMFVASDPPDRQLGSGGGTAHILLKAYYNSGTDSSFGNWLSASLKMIVHGSGESRRLQAYAPEGKPMMPLPHLPSFPAQAPLPVLLDLQISSYSRIARLAPGNYALMVTCGDVYLSFSEQIPAFPEADVLIVGMTASPDEAQHHGVMISHSSRPADLIRFLQKPSIEQLSSLDPQERYLLDTGVWLFSARAVKLLLSKCGVNQDSLSAGCGIMPDYYDMFATFGPALGSQPLVKDADLSSLTCAVLPLPDSKFYHFGSSRSIMASTAALLAPAEDKRSFANASLESFGKPIELASTVLCKYSTDNRHIWIDNSFVGKNWELKWNHILTGVPENDWNLQLDPGVCLTFVPMPEGRLLRFYGFDDSMRGKLSDGSAAILGQPLTEWLKIRQLSAGDLGFGENTDLYDMPLFPVLADWTDQERFIQWLIAGKPEQNAELPERYKRTKRCSARQVLLSADLLSAQSVRQESLAAQIAAKSDDSTSWSRYCTERDLARLAGMVKSGSVSLPASRLEWTPGDPAKTALGAIHERMLRDECGGGRTEHEAFSLLRDLIVHEMEIAPIAPRRNLMDDQLVWGRCPLRLDIAGGWSDTPPYCMEHGGKVTNVAVNLNGQPPIQVFGRISSRKDITLRSIDLGVTETITSYDELLKPGVLGSGFGVAKAALALIGFDPRFHKDHAYATLQDQLAAEFDGGIELNMVCAVPKGSGLGTSSILAATIIGTLNEMCGLNMDLRAVSQRTLALEQLLTSGGGWQDQLGGLTSGLKLISSRPSIAQEVDISWLPGTFFGPGYANSRVLLYYTGITRFARGILGEIVRNMFLNSSEHLSIIRDIAANASYAAEAFQRNNWAQVCEAVRRSWRLNQLLDSGTNPAPVQAIIDSVSDLISACKLLGAGGGGYLLMLAKDEEAGIRIKEILNAQAPSDTSRFVDLAISETGLQVTKS